jgi:hypothetical protein
MKFEAYSDWGVIYSWSSCSLSIGKTWFAIYFDFLGWSISFDFSKESK